MKILLKHLYENVNINELVAEYNIPASTIFTWETHADKYLKEGGHLNQKRKTMYASPYKDVKLVLFYWLKEMRSRDVPPPLTKETLRAKADR